jgi:hypothetical protein
MHTILHVQYALQVLGVTDHLQQDCSVVRVTSRYVVLREGCVGISFEVVW